MTRGFWPAVHGIMFGSRDSAKIFRIVALQTSYKRNAHARGEIRIFTVRLLAPTPAWVAKDIDIWRPEIESFHDVSAPRPYRLLVLGARFRANDYRHLVDQWRIECGRETDRLRKYRGNSCPRYTM